VPRQETANKEAKRVKAQGHQWGHSGECPDPAPLRPPSLQVRPGPIRLRQVLPQLPRQALRALSQLRGQGLPGAFQRRRCLLATLLAVLALALRPFPPFQGLPGWTVGGLVLWAIGEALVWLWRPQRWR